MPLSADMMICGTRQVLVQGNVVEKVAALLVERWGIPKQFVAIKLDKK